MFHNIPEAILRRMYQLERMDEQDRADDTPRLQRLRQITPDTGKFLALLAANVPEGEWIEIGTSAGYSTLWLALAARAVGAKVTTFELLPEKVALARQSFEQAGIADVVRLVEGDARDHLPEYKKVAFCFLDAEKEVYDDSYELVVPNLVEGGLLVADNATSHRETLQPLLDRALQDKRVDALIVPIGKGELVCRKRGTA